MRIFCSLLIFLLTAQISYPQNVTIPDANFKTRLLSLGFDTNEDGEISYAEAEAATTLDVSNQLVCINDSCWTEDKITSLEGIEAFINLESLNCSSNQLSNLDLSKNLHLLELHCGGNVLANLDISNNQLLEKLYCWSNQLSDLDISYNTSLTGLICDNNLLTSLDLSNNTALTYLSCYVNQLTSLDLSNNNLLASIECESNQLTSLDFSNNPLLISIYCGNNLLTNLDVSSCTELLGLFCQSNQLSSLDLSNNQKLCLDDWGTGLYINDNPNLHEVCVWEGFSTGIVMGPEDRPPFVCFETDCDGECSADTSESVDRFYPGLAELQTQLITLANDYPEIIQYNEIGTATHGDQPIMALKISDNVTETEDEPVWYFTGMIHGNEQIGLRILLDLAKELAEGYNSDPEIAGWVNAYEIWLVMTLNPWGYENDIMGNPNELGTRMNGPITDDPATTGVDLNRNFDFMWSTLEIGGYKGQYAFSENETQAIRDLILERKPVFGFTYHQGQVKNGGRIYWPTGYNIPNNYILTSNANRYAEGVYASRLAGPFCEEGPDDSFVLQDPYGDPCGTDENASSHCSELCWKPFVSPSEGAGQSNSWGFAAAGTIDLIAEVSTQDYNEYFMHDTLGPWSDYDYIIQDIASEFVRNHREGIKSWFQHFLYSADPIRYAGPGITGHVTDAQNGLPLSAVVEIVGTSNSLLADRTSDDKFGRFWRLLPAGKHLLKISSPGYISWQDSVEVEDDTPLKELEISLTPGSTGIENEMNEFQGEYVLSPIYPDRYSGTKEHIQFYLTVARNQRVEIAVYDLQGRKISTLYNDLLLAKTNQLFNFETGNLPSGLYLLRVRGKFFQTAKMLTTINKL